MSTRENTPEAEPEAGPEAVDFPLWSTQRAAQELEASERTVQRMAEQGKLTQHRSGEMPRGIGWDPIEVTNLARQRKGKPPVQLRVVDEDEPEKSVDIEPGRAPDVADLFRTASAMLKEQQTAYFELTKLIVNPLKAQGDAWGAIAKAQAYELKELRTSGAELTRKHTEFLFERAAHVTEQHVVVEREGQRSAMVGAFLKSLPTVLARMTPRDVAPSVAQQTPDQNPRDAALFELASTLDEQLVDKLTPRQKELLEGIVASFISPKT